MKKSLIWTFYTLIGASLAVAGEFFIPVIREFIRGSILFLLPVVVFFLLGIVLVFLTLKQKIEGKLKKYLILTGISSAGFFIFIFLHNAFYGLGIITKHITGLSYLIEALHVIFFIISIFICPVGFLVGAGVCITLFVRKEKSANIIGLF